MHIDAIPQGYGSAILKSLLPRQAGAKGIHVEHSRKDQYRSRLRSMRRALSSLLLDLSSVRIEHPRLDNLDDAISETTPSCLHQPQRVTMLILRNGQPAKSGFDEQADIVVELAPKEIIKLQHGIRVVVRLGNESEDHRTANPRRMLILRLMQMPDLAGASRCTDTHHRVDAAVKYGLAILIVDEIFLSP